MAPGMTIAKLPKDGGGKVWVTPNRLYLNKDKTKIVPEGSVEAASLLSAVGHQITDADCKKYGLGPYASSGDDTTDDTGASASETTTDTEPEPEGPQIGLQSLSLDEQPEEPAKTRPRRKK